MNVSRMKAFWPWMLALSLVAFPAMPTLADGDAERCTSECPDPDDDDDEAGDDDDDDSGDDDDDDDDDESGDGDDDESGGFDF